MTIQYRVVDTTDIDAVRHQFKPGEIVTRAAPTVMTALIEMLGAKEYTNGDIIQGLTPDQVEAIDE